MMGDEEFETTRDFLCVCVRSEGVECVCVCEGVECVQCSS